ncbi:MAG: hypothetical protein PHV02_16080 [Rhodocyclaceae bacterium]|nr:hypothetical protein [Rhodocyclaceae bacterium]
MTEKPVDYLTAARRLLDQFCEKETPLANFVSDDLDALSYYINTASEKECNALGCLAISAIVLGVSIGKNDPQNAAKIIAEHRSDRAKNAADARHDMPGGSRAKKQQMRDIWASGKYSSRDVCAEQECAAVGLSYDKARKALIGTPAAMTMPSTD